MHTNKEKGFPTAFYGKHPELISAAILAYRGSFVHGTYVPKDNPDSIDDIDVMGICIPPISHYFGLGTFGSKGTVEIMDGEWDIVLYEYIKAIRLLMKGNPNILQMLWLEPQFYIRVNSIGQLLLDNRDLFSAKNAYHAYIGYAHGQFHRMTHAACKGYMGAKRKELVDRFGYDCKNATHLIRLLRMGIEFLTEGRLYPTRPDAAQLKEIKRGEWSLEKVKKEADELFRQANEAYIRSPLPMSVDKDKVNDLCVIMGIRAMEV